MFTVVLLKPIPWHFSCFHCCHHQH
jgi:hypothetical protein